MDENQIRKIFIESAIKSAKVEDTEPFDDFVYRLTGLTLKEIRELKERDTAKALMECHYEEPGEEPYIKYTCPNGCKIQPSRRSKFCSLCGQRLKWED